MHRSCGAPALLQMADSKFFVEQLDVGMLQRAMAFKVKYRKKFGTAEKPLFKNRIPWDFVGAHPWNRGRNFPNGETCKCLARAVISMGVQMEEADHMGVVVE